MRDAPFAEVIAAARGGDERAITTLFEVTQPRLLRFLRSQEPRLADDLASEVWISVARGIHGFDGDEDGFRAWVFTIARRRIVDARRSALRRPLQAVHVDSNGDGHPASSTESTERIALDALSGQQAVDLVSELLEPDQAEVVLLRVLADLDCAQVAAIMGRTENWVRVTQHRALKRLSERVGSRLGVTL